MAAAVTDESEQAWNKFLAKIDKARKKLDCADPTGEEAWYRGHTRSDFQLLPSLFRGYKNPKKGKTWNRIWALESDLFWEFSARARELHATLRSDWDYLFAMQHYGTPTRLLDWTEVLGAAVYFAALKVDETQTVDDKSKPIPPPCVWVLNPYGLNRASTGNKNADLFTPEILGWDGKEYYTYGELLLEPNIDFDWPYAIYPRQMTPRLHAQRAWFTIHGDKFIAMDEFDDKKDYLAKVELPFEALPSARRFLDHAGIDHYLLFADLENLSRHLREKNGLTAHR